jgi:hypothetical protein
MPSSITVVEETSNVVAKPEATAVEPVTAAPVAALVIVNCVEVLEATVALDKLKAVVDKPVIVTVCPTTRLFTEVYVIVPDAAEAAVTVEVTAGTKTLMLRLLPRTGA